MRFDVVIIGSGLAGLACGIRLAAAGKYCALVSSGQSALHFSSGSFDLLNMLPDGSPVESPEQALPALVEQSPEHPYALLGADKTLALAREAEMLLRESGLALHGGVARNHLRLTPLGKLAPTWLSDNDVPTAWPDAPLPWKKAAVVNIEGFLDFYPEIIAEALARMGMQTFCAQAGVPALALVRENPSEYRSVNIARTLDRPDTLDAFIKSLEAAAGDADVVLLPACLGFHDSGPINEAAKRLGRPVRLVPTLPPSLIGARINHILLSRFRCLGGVVMPGDTATVFDMDGNAVSKLFTVHHEDIPLIADHYVLASGGFFSNGLRADMHSVRESVFGLDLVASADRTAWVAENFFDAQPYAKFGVKTDASMRGGMGGKTLTNLYAAGMVLGGYDAVKTGCGAGVALVSAMAAAHAILESGVPS